MSYTVLRLTPDGIVLVEGQLRRLGAHEGPAREALRHWARRASPGVWSITLSNYTVTAVARPGSRLTDGMPARTLPSPLDPSRGSVAKPPSPSVYDSVRVAGVATVLTSPDGAEAWEACSGAVVSSQEGQLVLVPGDRPRVESVTEHLLRRQMAPREAPIRVGVGDAIAVINAVVGVCTIQLPGSVALPERLRRQILDVVHASVGWP